MSYERYSVSRLDREPLLRFMTSALQASGCRLLFVSEPNLAPFRITFETPIGERIGIVAYAFLANSRQTKNRPSDEHRLQIKYGSKNSQLHSIYEDPFSLYTTLFIGINPDLGIFVAADPRTHNPTKFFISLEFKQANADQALREGWTSWERRKQGRKGIEDPVEVLVAGTQANFLKLVRFERAAVGLDPGHRQLLAEMFDSETKVSSLEVSNQGLTLGIPGVPHSIADEFQLTQSEILDLVASAPRLKMAVRGWVAEEHLRRSLLLVPGVENCEQIRTEGGADVRLNYYGSRTLEIECKNVLRTPLADGTIKLDFQRTRASKADPCSRYYSHKDFDIVAACLHSCTQLWEFEYILPEYLDAHSSCKGKISHRVRLDGRWTRDVESVLAAAAAK